MESTLIAIAPPVSLPVVVMACGPLTQCKLWPADGVAQTKVNPPGEIVSGVGWKKLLPTVIVLLWPPAEDGAPVSVHPPTRSRVPRSVLLVRLALQRICGKAW